MLDSTVRQAIRAALAGAVTHVQRTRRPFVTLSYAQSLDGSITSHPGAPIRLSGAAALRLTHELRAGHDAILVGIGTILTDDPRLTVRLVEGSSPRPVVIDSRLRFPLTATLLRGDQVRPWIATCLTGDPPHLRALVDGGVRILRLPSTDNGWVDLPALLDLLAELGVRRLMVEGGARVITSFLAGRLVDQAVITIVPRLLGGPHAVGPLRAAEHGCLPHLVNVQYEALGDDLVVRGDLAWGRP